MWNVLLIYWVVWIMFIMINSDEWSKIVREGYEKTFNPRERNEWIFRIGSLVMTIVLPFILPVWLVFQLMKKR
jgi:fatty acid desaturase